MDQAAKKQQGGQQNKKKQAVQAGTRAQPETLPKQHLMPGDVTDYAFCEQAVEATRREFGRLDVLVNNAAFQAHTQSLENLSLEHFDRTIKTNLYGYFHMAKAAVPHMGRGGSIINTGSVTGLLGSKELLDYSMTKGGISSSRHRCAPATSRARSTRSSAATAGRELRVRC